MTGIPEYGTGRHEDYLTWQEEQRDAAGPSAPGQPRADSDRLLDWAARLIVAAAEGADVSSGGWRTEQRDWLGAFNATPPVPLAPDDAEVAYEQWTEHRDPASAGSMAGFSAGWKAAVAAAGGWPLCPNGCGCRLGTEDADRRDCACDGLCCYDEVEVSAVFAERDGLRAKLETAERELESPRADAGTVTHIPTGATWVSWDYGKQPPWEQVAEAVARLTDGGVKIGGGRDEDSGRLYVAVYRDLPEAEDE